MRQALSSYEDTHLEIDIEFMQRNHESKTNFLLSYQRIHNNRFIKFPKINLLWNKNILSLSKIISFAWTMILESENGFKPLS